MTTATMPPLIHHPKWPRAGIWVEKCDVLAPGGLCSRAVTTNSPIDKGVSRVRGNGQPMGSPPPVSAVSGDSPAPLTQLSPDIQKEKGGRVSSVSGDTGVDENRPPSLIVTIQARNRDCALCGQDAWWRHASGRWICAGCHPPPAGKEALRRGRS